MKTTRTNPQQRVRTAVYRLYSRAGELLYVGISDKPTRRWTQHEAGKPWYSEVHTSTVEWCPSREDALRIERRAIRVEGPLYNIDHKLTGATLAVVREWLHAVGYGVIFAPDVWHEARIDKAVSEVEKLTELFGDALDGDDLEPARVVDGLIKWWWNGTTVDEIPCFVFGTCCHMSQHIRCSTGTSSAMPPAPVQPAAEEPERTATGSAR